MDSTDDVYYTENTEIIDGADCWDMQEAVIVDNDGLHWQEDGPEITVSYSEDETEQTLTESEVYLSMNAEDSANDDKSEYYSILETTYQPETEYQENVTANIIVNCPDNNESILPDLPGTEDYSDKEENKECINEEFLSNQVVLYHADDPNEMYAVQIADDGSGNLQRYKYKVRPTADGQLEAIPGTIEVQEADIENEIFEKTDITQDILSSTIPEGILNMKHEICDDSPNDLIQIQENESEIEEEITETKGHFLDPKVTTEHIEENFDASESYLDEEYGTPEYLLSDDNLDEESVEQNYETNEEEDLGIKIQNNFSLEHFNPEIVYSEDNDSNFTEFQQKTDDEELERVEPVQVYKRKFFKSRDSNSPYQVYGNKNGSGEREITIIKGEKNVSYLVIDRKEKENVQINRRILPKNSRSILKSNCTIPENMKQGINIKKVSSVRMLNNNKGLVAKVKEVIMPELKQEEKKETEVKILAKSARQPRKQTIKPIERSGSEIIVQPMFYSVNSDHPLFMTKKRKYSTNNPQEVVKVSDDSDPDYTEKPKPKKKKSLTRRISRSKKITHITISDSEESAVDKISVIELLSDQEFEDIEKNSKTDTVDTVDVQIEDDLDKSDDIMKIQEAVDVIVQERDRNKIEKQKEIEKKNGENVDKSVSKKNNIKCPICPKTFARQINLKIHTNVHNVRRDLRSKTTENKPEKIDKSTIPKKSLNINTKKSVSFICNICKFKCFSESQLSRHKVIHIKKTVSKVTSPKKQFLRSSVNIGAKTRLATTLKNTPKRKLSVSKTEVTNKLIKSPKGPYKCEFCTKSFSQRTLLSSHRAIHKQFLCSSCGVKFSTKFLLDEHVRKNCVKIKSPVHKAVSRLSVKNKTILSNTKILSNLSKMHENDSKKESNKLTNVKKVIVKPKNAHGGVPASGKMQRAFDKMKLRS